ncbi:hypothetical protein PRZ48_009025 [Zasmidium cellare]|uniref:DUF4185 domain-containing protein n=1 Tax=Zasmidium cellare TaxID=395010 RepID=A0ABR0EI74_ZASCE|nr:hypothetical protein PRZ48_009025 [Zasmidium cellare]
MCELSNTIVKYRMPASKSKMINSTVLASVTFLLLLPNPAYSQQPANPIRVNTSATQFLGAQKSRNDQNILLSGAEGHIGNTYYQIYADVCQKTNPTDEACSTFLANAIAVETLDPTLVDDYYNPPKMFCNGLKGGRVHMANLVPTGGNAGALWYVELGSCDGFPVFEQNGCPVAAGVATATAPASGQPSCIVMPGFWDTKHEPQFGATAAIGPEPDGYIYLFGSLDANAPGANLSDVYVARVLPGDVTNLGEYQYWDGTAFTSTRIIDPVFNGTYDRPSVLQGVSVGSVFYNAYYKKYIALSAPGGNQLVAYAASSPQGPYSAGVQIWSNSTIGGLYIPIGLPARDTSGQTLVVDLSQYGPNNIQVVLKLFFE